MSSSDNFIDTLFCRLFSAKRHIESGAAQGAFLSCGLIFVALLAVIHIIIRPAWGDETITLLTLAGHAEPNWSNGRQEFYGYSSFGQIASTLTFHDFHPPAYFCLAEIWRHLTGPSLIAARSLSTLLVLISLFVAYRVAKGWGMKFCAVPAMLFGLSGATMMYAATARQYAMAELLILLTIYCGQRRSLWTGAVAALAVATHYYAGLAVTPILAVALIANCKTNRRWALITGSLFCLGVITLTPFLRVQAAARLALYPETSPLYREIAALAVGESLAGFPLSSHWPISAVSVTVVVSCLIFGARKSVARGNLVPLVGFLSFSALFLCSEHASRKPLPDSFPIPYYVGFSVPFLSFLIAYGVEDLPVLNFVLLPALLTSALSWNDRYFPHSNIGQIEALFRSHCKDCVLVAGASTARGTAAALLYQVRDIPVFVLAKPGDVKRVADAARDARRIYFIPATSISSLGGIEGDFLQKFPEAQLLSSGIYILDRRTLTEDTGKP